MTWYTGPRTAHQLALLGERVAQGDADGDALIRHAGLWLGPLAEAFKPVVTRFQHLGRHARDVKEHIAALYQINPHYVLLCTMDGEIVEANPAFYAATGLPIAAVRGGRVEALRETFPVEPLMELAVRSLKEGSAITGIEYAIISRDDETRPVEVSIRGFDMDGRKMVLFQATDQAHEKQLERRVAAFTDTLDLMVDQRVHQLSAGQDTLRRVLDASGRWSGGAEALTGRAIASVPHFAAATDVLGLSPTERTAFTQWFWSLSQTPFFGRHGVIGRDGETRTRQVIWQRVDADMGGRSDLRTLVGVEIPLYVDLSGESGDSLPRGAHLGV
jgi:PAS domain S-box-containing protein